MRLSDTGLKELTRAEGVRSQVYDDATGRTVSSWGEVRGYPTIALGRLITPGDRPRFERYLGGREKLTGSALDDVIRDTIGSRERQLTTLLTVPTSQGQFDALFSMMFNTGAGNKTFKASLAAHNALNVIEAARQIAAGTVTSKGVVIAGLVRRRAREAAAYAAAAAGGVGPSGWVGAAILAAAAAVLGLVWYRRSRAAPRVANPPRRRARNVAVKAPRR